MVETISRGSPRVTPNFLLGLDIDRAIIGSSVDNSSGPQQQRLGDGIDVSYRFWDRYSIFAQDLVSDVKNRQFRPGDNGVEHMLRFELTRSFR